MRSVKTTTALFTKGVTKNYTLCGLTISKATCGNKMLLYLLIRNKYRLKVFKYTIIVNAGNFQSGNIVVSNNKDKAAHLWAVFYLLFKMEEA